MAAQAGLCLAWSETPEDTFCRVVSLLIILIILYMYMLYALVILNLVNVLLIYIQDNLNTFFQLLGICFNFYFSKI